MTNTPFHMQEDAIFKWPLTQSLDLSKSFHVTPLVWHSRMYCLTDFPNLRTLNIHVLFPFCAEYRQLQIMKNDVRDRGFPLVERGGRASSGRG